MGFQLRCAIAPCHGDAAAVATAMAELPLVIVKHLAAPYDAMIAGVLTTDLDEAREMFPGALPPDDNVAYDIVLEGVMNALPALSRKFPGKPFGYVHVDCFGGTCMYNGEVVQDGVVLWRGEHSQETHQHVLARLGLPFGWYFPPFVRGFFDDDAPPPPAEERRPIACTVAGSIGGLGLSAITLAIQMMPPPWRITLANPINIVFVYGQDDIALSINTTGDDSHSIGGRSHIDPDSTASAIGELCFELDSLGVDLAVTVNDFATRAVLRSFP